ncbi:hypothetical protein [Dickeya ananatis]|uniref:hypothetical protein n=1 Tax=Dickeya ananatis TaxID=3061286 RepID=UPI00388E59A4
MSSAADFATEDVVVENNFFGKALVEGCAIAAPCRTKIAEQLLEIGVKAGITGVVAKEIADNLSPEELEHLVTLQMMGNDEITGKYLNSLQDKYGSDNASTPNLGKGLTNEQKSELGGSGSGTPGGWGPEDEENGRKGQSAQPNESDSANSQPLSVAEKIGILRDAAKGNKGNFGLGQATTQEANALGESWVGPGYRISKDGTTWVSQDGLRTYRPPSAKPNSTQATTGVQANFEQKLTPGGRPISNGHLDITK